MPAPVVVMKDVGGYVNQYQSQTELYRATDREVRLHECRSACTLALSLPNVCVYPDSTLKFHLAYDPRNHESNYDVSQQLFNSYPPAVREKLGPLTRQYKVLRGSELIALGVRNCNAPRPGEPQIMVASNGQRKAAPAALVADARTPAGPQASMFGGLMRNVASVFGAFGGKSEPQQARIQMARVTPGKPPSFEQLSTDAPLPPPRPVGIATPAEDRGEAAGARLAPNAAGVEAADEIGSAARPVESDAPPPSRAGAMEITYAYGMARVTLPKVIGGAQKILPARFVAYAELAR
ncbi:conserved hypothetical protein [Methylocella tundrae]|uniref:Uncharacterized protein n=2 Tax=Methylocella tundrae TaxID=227605 RepID=A0A8B6MBE6_METTU|nr:conserved hypothetical protein [Methylocella tundrae]